MEDWACNDSLTISTFMHSWTVFASIVTSQLVLTSRTFSCDLSSITCFTWRAFKTLTHACKWSVIAIWTRDSISGSDTFKSWWAVMSDCTDSASCGSCGCNNVMTRWTVDLGSSRWIFSAVNSGWTWNGHLESYISVESIGCNLGFGLW